MENCLESVIPSSQVFTPLEEGTRRFCFSKPAQIRRETCELNFDKYLGGEWPLGHWHWVQVCTSLGWNNAGLKNGYCIKSYVIYQLLMYLKKKKILKKQTENLFYLVWISAFVIPTTLWVVNVYFESLLYLFDLIYLKKVIGMTLWNVLIIRFIVFLQTQRNSRREILLPNIFWLFSS